MGVGWSILYYKHKHTFSLNISLTLTHLLHLLKDIHRTTEALWTLLHNRLHLLKPSLSLLFQLYLPVLLLLYLDPVLGLGLEDSFSHV